MPIKYSMFINCFSTFTTFVRTFLVATKYYQLITKKVHPSFQVHENVSLIFFSAHKIYVDIMELKVLNVTTFLVNK